MSTPAQNSGPDVGQLVKDKSLPEATFPGGRNQPFRVYLAPEVHSGIWQHAIENGAVEICGVVVGKWAHDASGPHAQATAYIRGEAASSKFAEVTFTHETWARINEQMDKKYTDLKVIGWYHSHPDFGIFLSDRDMFIQEHFFAGPGQFAYVVDPVRKTEGVFVWNKGKAVLAPYHWVGDRVQASTPAAEKPAGHGERGGDKQAATEPVQAGPQVSPAALWIDALLRPAGYVCLFMLGFLLSGFVAPPSSEIVRHIREDARVGSLIYLNYRPGLGEELDEVGKDLANVNADLGSLFKQQPEMVQKTDEIRDKWLEVGKRLIRAQAGVMMAREKYSLNPEENARLMKLLKGDNKTGAIATERVLSPKTDATSREPERKPAETGK